MVPERQGGGRAGAGGAGQGSGTRGRRGAGTGEARGRAGAGARGSEEVGAVGEVRAELAQLARAAAPAHVHGVADEHEGLGRARA